MDQNLLKRIEVLEKWKEEKTRQQISYPLDFQSQTILGKYFLSKVGDIVYSAGMAGAFFNIVLAQQDGQTSALQALGLFTSYRADPSSDELTIATGRFADNDQVIIVSTDTPPNPLVSGDSYHVVNASSDGKTFELSLTSGGAAINITNSGTGGQYLYFFT